MIDSEISIRLIEDVNAYLPGQTLSGEFFVQIDEPHDVRAVEVSVLWFTEGKGDEDMAVHYFDRISNEDGQFVDMRQSQQFATDLPESPLSYEGVIMKIHWCVRIRVFLSRGRDFATEQPFQLGAVPRGLAVMDAADRETDRDPDPERHSEPDSRSDSQTNEQQPEGLPQIDTATDRGDAAEDHTT